MTVLVSTVWMTSKTVMLTLAPTLDCLMAVVIVLASSVGGAPGEAKGRTRGVHTQASVSGPLLREKRADSGILRRGSLGGN